MRRCLPVVLVLVAVLCFAAQAQATTPAPPVLTGTHPTSPGSSTHVSITGTADAITTTVRIYDNATCSGSPLITGTKTSFVADGLFVVVPSGSTTTFWATASQGIGTPSDCSTTNVTYVNDQTPPGPPTITGTDPASPSSATAIHVTFTAPSDAATLQLYTEPTCTSAPVATGPTAGGSLAVQIAPNATTTFWGIAKDQAGNASTCSATSASYTNDSTPPAVPTLSATTPASPSPSLTPVVTGTADAGSTVNVYANATCTGTPLATGTAAAFASPGLAVTVAPSATTTLYATASDPLGNVSACSAGLAYTNAPVVPVLSNVSLTRCLGTGPGGSAALTLRYQLNIAATLTVTLQTRVSPPAPVYHRCPKPSVAGTGLAPYDSGTSTDLSADTGDGFATVNTAGAVTRSRVATRPTPVTATIASHHGVHRVSLMSVARAAGLAPGRYRLLLHATAATGAQSTISTVWFWVLAPSRN